MGQRAKLCRKLTSCCVTCSNLRADAFIAYSSLVRGTGIQTIDRRAGTFDRGLKRLEN